MAAWLVVWCFCMFILGALRYVYSLLGRPKIIEWKLKRQGIDGLPYKFLDGNGKEIRKVVSENGGSNSPLKLPHDIVPLIDPFLQKQAISFKKIFVIWRGTMPRVTIMDPKIIREILSKSLEFHKPEVHWSMKYFLMGLANIDGHKWVKHRKIINPAFHVEKLKQMMPAFKTCCEEMVEKWDKLMDNNGSLELDVFPEFLDLTGDVISRAAFGSNLEDGRMIFTLQREQAKLFLHSLVASNFPWSRYLPTRVNRRMQQIRKEVAALLGSMIDDRERAIQSGGMENNDLLTVLLKSNHSEMQGINGNQSKNGMSRDDIIEECKLFYFAGHETTANLLAWTMIALSMHQDWQEKARDEVIDAFGKSGKPTFDQLNRLKIVNMILLEVLRLYPPTSLVRWTYKETKVGDLSLPAGVLVQMPLYMVHRDTESWGEDAIEFNPERFSNGVSKASKDQVSFFSFGWGPRICIGQNFALIEAKLALSLILQRFAFRLAPTYTHAPSINLTLQPKFGAQIVLHKV